MLTFISLWRQWSMTSVKVIESLKNTWWQQISGKSVSADVATFNSLVSSFVSTEFGTREGRSACYESNLELVSSCVHIRYHLLDTAQFCWEGVKMLRNDGFSCWNFISKARYLKTESNVVLSVHILDSAPGPNCLKRGPGLHDILCEWTSYTKNKNLIKFPSAWRVIFYGFHTLYNVALRENKPEKFTYKARYLKRESNFFFSLWPIAEFSQHCAVSNKSYLLFIIIVGVAKLWILASLNRPIS